MACVLAQIAVPRMGDAREDWMIIRALSEVCGRALPYDTLEGVRARLADVAPHFGAVDPVQAPIWLNGEYFKVRLALRVYSICCCTLRGKCWVIY